MQKLISFFICLLLFSSSKSELRKEQETIISVLSGQTTLPNGKVITNRSSKENRALTRTYLSSLINDINLQPQIQTYKMPNLNPLIDLMFNPFDGANVYTTLPSTTNSDEYIILGAHFDTERNCPGAIDNATGVTLIYSVLKQLTKLKERNKNVIVIFFDQEEEDLIGSKAFAKYCKKEDLNIHSVHTFDTMGWDRDHDLAIELELPSESLKALYVKHAKLLDIPLHFTKVNSTDHQSFRALGYNAIGLTDEYANGDYAPYKDTINDTYDTVNFEYLESCTNLVHSAIKDLITQ